jgi:hypothetical protein
MGAGRFFRNGCFCNAGAALHAGPLIIGSLPLWLHGVFARKRAPSVLKTRLSRGRNNLRHALGSTYGMNVLCYGVVVRGGCGLPPS